MDNLNVKVDGVIVALGHDEIKRFSFSTGFLFCKKRKSVLMCEGCLMKKKDLIIEGCNAKK